MVIARVLNRIRGEDGGDRVRGQMPADLQMVAQKVAEGVADEVDGEHWRGRGRRPRKYLPDMRQRTLGRPR